MKFYRYIDDLLFGIEIRLEEYFLIKETPCGYWIDISNFHSKLLKKWISKTSRKKFAYPTKEEALTSFKARKNKQLQILKSNIKRVEHIILLLKNNVYSTSELEELGVEHTFYLNYIVD